MGGCCVFVAKVSLSHYVQNSSMRDIIEWGDAVTVTLGKSCNASKYIMSTTNKINYMYTQDFPSHHARQL